MILSDQQPSAFGHDCSQPHVPGPVPSALHQGVQFLQQNQLGRALDCFERAALANPRDPVAHNCLGIVARNERRLADAMSLFQKAIELHPAFAEAHNNLGNAYRDAGDIDQAATCYRRALVIKPEFAEAHNNLGVVLLGHDTVAEAVRCFETAIALNPQFAEAHNNLASAFRQSGDLVGAAASFSLALQLKPASPEIHNNLANVLRDSGQRESAREHYEQAIRLQPDFAEAHGNIGTLLFDLGRGEEALRAYERAEQLQPQSISTLLNLGNAYRLVGQIDDARNIYQRAAQVEPDNFWHRLRIASLCPPAFSSQSEIETHRQRALADWRQLAEERRLAGPPPLNSWLVEPAFAWQFLDGNLRRLKEAYANIFGAGWPQTDSESKVDRPRVGIIITSGHEGLFLRSLSGVLQRIHSSQFQVVILGPSSSEAVFRRAVVRDMEFVPLPCDFHQIVSVVRAAHLSVLYHWEIGTDATNYFLPFLRLAPVQCTSWGIQVTSGIRHIGYYLSSELVEPTDGAEHYTEQLLLSSTLLTYQIPPTLPTPAKSRSDFGFADHQHLYACAQQQGKLHPDFDAMIAGILRRDGNGLFVTVHDRYRPATEIVRTRLLKYMPDVADRIVFLPRLEFSDYLQLLNVADVLLDPPHFGGVNSTYDALAIGRPMITLPSQYHRGRYTAACLRLVGASHLVAQDRDDYVRLATSWATDRKAQQDLRMELQKSSSALFRDERSVREHERLFKWMLQASFTAQPQAPAPFGLH